MRALLPVAWALVLSVAAVGAAQLDVDTAGGPLDLPERVEAAFRLWQESVPDEELVEPEARVAYAPDLLGPDTASLTLRYDDGRTEVLLSPERSAAGPVLVHEIGVLLGLSPEGDGVMDPALEEDSPTAPTPSDVALLLDLRAFPPADLTRDGVVDFYDLAAFGEAFGSVGINLEADLNGDGRVDEEDRDILREAYTFSEPARAAPGPRNLVPEPGAETTPTPATPTPATPDEIESSPDVGGEPPLEEVPPAGDDGADAPVEDPETTGPAEPDDPEEPAESADPEEDDS